MNTDSRQTGATQADSARPVVAPFTMAQINFQDVLPYNQDGLATKHNCDFMKDARFLEALQHGIETGSWPNPVYHHWRIYVACWAAQQAARLEGDFVECGVNRGGLALTVIHYVGFAKLPKLFYLMDTFQGLDAKYLVAEEHRLDVANRYAGRFPECYEAVRETFKPYLNVRIVRGSIPETLSQVPAKQVSYLSIDMNCALPEVAAAEYFWDKLVPGAYVLLDDYGFIRHVAQKKAMDRFAASKDVQILSLPTGQGLIVKPSWKPTR